ncbi:TetR/AcrR family transcriptional regulator C-terminal domain-containing protein [Arthrobacter sp. UYEF36]|uniref:TetR/AcrR family transcriptional regulator n=1 Tax=Arthrobacter sp. UYEF36 TaxID=1756366 RepID=UPI00339ADCCE
MTQQLEAARRTPLNRERVLQGAVALADDVGLESLSMRRLAEDLGVVPMAIYKHVSNKDELLDGMVASLIGEIDPPGTELGWKGAVRLRVLSARQALQRHPWARRAIESRTNKTPAVLDYMDSFAGMFLAGGFSADLTHHVMHALGGRMWGFTQELFDDPAVPTAESPAGISPEAQAAMVEQMAARYPNIVAIATAATHEEGSVVGHGCDDQFEFEFALDLLLDGFERLHEQGWSSRQAKLNRPRAGNQQGVPLPH